MLDTVASCHCMQFQGKIINVQYQKKTNDLILRKLSDGRTDEQTDESDFIGRCLTNVERAIDLN